MKCAIISYMNKYIKTNKKIFSWLILATLIVSIYFIVNFLAKLGHSDGVQPKKQSHNSLRVTESKMDPNAFRSSLGVYEQKKFFSVPENMEINSFCPNCEKENVDSIEGQGWEFVVSDDYKQYAYIRWDPFLKKRSVSLNGNPQGYYDNIYLLSFLDNSDKTLMYRAYNKRKSRVDELEEDMTYVVYDRYTKIPVYAGPEGYPHAANGTSVDVGRDGRMVYGKVFRGSSQIHIMIHDMKKHSTKEDEELNVVEGEFLRIKLIGDDIHYVVLEKSEYSYYKNEKFVRKISLDEFNTFHYWVRGNGEEGEQREDDVVIKEKKVLVGGEVIVDYADRDEKVYFSEAILDDKQNNVVCIAGIMGLPNKKWISLNGNDSEEIFNDIKNLKFTDDGKISFAGRRGRDVHYVSYEIKDLLTEKKNDIERSDIDVIKEYYSYISNGDLQNAWKMKGNDVSWDVFRNRYENAKSVVPDNFRQIGDHVYAFNVQYEEEYKREVEEYDVVMRVQVESGKIYTQTVHGEKEKVVLSDNTIATIQDVNGKKEVHVLRGDRDYLIEKSETEWKDGRSNWVNYGNIKLIADRYLVYQRYGWEYQEVKIYDLREERHMVKLPMLSSGNFTKNEDYFYACTLDHFGGTFYIDIYNAPSFNKVSDLVPLLNPDYSSYFKDSMECNYNNSSDKLRVELIYKNFGKELEGKQFREVWEYDFKKESWQNL